MNRMERLKRELRRLLPSIVTCAVAFIIGEMLSFTLGFSPYLFPEADVKGLIIIEIIMKCISLILIVGGFIGLIMILLSLVVLFKNMKDKEVDDDEPKESKQLEDKSPEEFDINENENNNDNKGEEFD